MEIITIPLSVTVAEDVIDRYSAMSFDNMLCPTCHDNISINRAEFDIEK